MLSSAESGSTDPFVQKKMQIQSKVQETKQVSNGAPPACLCFVYW